LETEGIHAWFSRGSIIKWLYFNVLFSQAFCKDNSLDIHPQAFHPADHSSQKGPWGSALDLSD
jgi:hypothetical protein